MVLINLSIYVEAKFSLHLTVKYGPFYSIEEYSLFPLGGYYSRLWPQ